MNICLQRLQSVMENKHINARELAEQCGLGSTTIYGWFRRQSLPDAEQLARICEHLNVSANYMLGLDRLDASTDLSDTDQMLLSVARNLTLAEIADVIGYASYLQKSHGNAGMGTK